ncbi:MAG: hypothetical protein ABSA47_01565 [Verrucomicrobiota bacterium]
MPHLQQELGLPEHKAGSADSPPPPPPLEAKTDSFLLNLVEPHLGQAVPSQRLERASSSLSFPHF